LQELLPETAEFLRLLLELVFLADLAAKLSELNAELQGENKKITRVAGINDYLKEKRKLRNT
jgi:hypothetical protein